MRSWFRFFQQFQADLKLWFFCVVFLAMFRIFFIISLYKNMDAGSGIWEILKVCMFGFRFDSMVAAYYILIPFLLSIFCGFVDIRQMADRVRIIIAGLFVILSTFLCTVNYSFFQEYNDQINPLFFQFFLDDTEALLITFWQDYHPILNLMAMLFVFTGGFIVVRQFIRADFIPEGRSRIWFPTTLRKYLVTVCILVFVVISARGTLETNPLDRRILIATNDEFLNKTILNVYSSLRYAFLDFQTMTRADKGLEQYLPDRDVLKAAQYAFSKTDRYSCLDDYYLKYADGPVHNPPRNIFVIIGESYDSWPLLSKYRPLGLMENLKYFIRNGISIDNFLPASDLTMFSLGVLLTGLPDSGIIINQHISSLKPYPSAIAEIFNRLGWRTRFFYGGYPTWQRVTDFALSQGFKEAYDATSLAFSTTKNPWGVDDAELFDLVLRVVKDDVPSLNVILTTNNHTPYTIKVWDKGFPLHVLPEDMKTYWDDTISLNILGHQWYTDVCIGNFIRKMEDNVQLPLFVITADHYGRNFVNRKPDLYEKSAVPFVMYGKEILKGIPRIVHQAGSHLDIPPTLIELVAPKGFAYHAMGQNLLSQEGQSIGIARNKVITPEYIVDFSVNPMIVFSLSSHQGGDSLLNMGKIKKLHDALHGIAWWRVKNGPDTNIRR
jgi:phosphoglycerol transferase MdoB-like AlkP superfamily enzyme